MGLPASSQLAARQARVRQCLDTLNLDALVVTSAANIRYLSNHRGSSGFLVLTRDLVHLLVDFRYREAVQMLQRSASACPGLVARDVPASYDEALLLCLGDIGVAVAGFEAAHVSVARHQWWQRTVEARPLDIAFKPTERAIEEARLIKDAFEIATLRDAAARLTSVAESVFEATRAGESERAVAAAIESALRHAGYERPSFDTIVASGPNAALPHHRAGDRVLAEGDLVVLDFGGVLDGYCSDLTRTVSIGPAGGRTRDVYYAVREAHGRAIEAVAPGRSRFDVDAAARDTLTRHGLGEAFGHGTGHGLGIEVHEDPRIARRRPELDVNVADEAIAAGMVFTIEPGAYLPGWGGVRIEDDVLVTEQGVEVLTEVTTDLIEI